LVEGIVALNEDNDLALLQTHAPANVAHLSLAGNVESEGEKVTMVSALDEYFMESFERGYQQPLVHSGAGEYCALRRKFVRATAAHLSLMTG